MSAATAVDTAAADTPSAVPQIARLWRWSGPRLNPQRNSLNMLRLVFAIAVLYHHTFPLGGFPARPALGGIQVGEWAVLSFFCLSGYLITSSRLAKPLASYMAHRVARIFPAFWVCLAATAFLIAPIEYVHRTGGLDGYLSQPGVTPINYVLVNLWLRIGSFSIGDSLAGAPFPSAWNGSLWTLYYEFLCYMLLGAMLLVRRWRRSATPMIVVWVISLVLYFGREELMPYLGGNPHAFNFMHFAPFFLGGACIAMLRSRLPLHWTGALVSFAVVATFLYWSPEAGIHLASPAITYLILWLGHVVPAPQTLRAHDISYGVYIYAFPIQQLLVVFGAAAWGIAGFSAAALAITVPVAVASWLLVERPVMRKAKRADDAAPKLSRTGEARGA